MLCWTFEIYNIFYMSLVSDSLQFTPLRVLHTHTHIYIYIYNTIKHYQALSNNILHMVPTSTRLCLEDNSRSFQQKRSGSPCNLAES